MQKEIRAGVAGAAATAIALSLPGVVGKVRDGIDQFRRVERDREARLEDLVAQVERHEEEIQKLIEGLDATADDLTVLVAVVAQQMGDALEKPYNEDVQQLVFSRLNAARLLADRQERIRAWVKSERERKRAEEEREAGTSLRCPECDELRPDWAKWATTATTPPGKGQPDPPACPNCGSNEEPK